MPPGSGTRRARVPPPSPHPPLKAHKSTLGRCLKPLAAVYSCLVDVNDDRARRERRNRRAVGGLRQERGEDEEETSVHPSDARNVRANTLTGDH